MFTMDSEAFRKDLARGAEHLPGLVSRALKYTADFAALAARSSKLYNRRTGALQKSTKGELVSPVHSRTIAGAKHAGFLEDGTQPHRIPKSGIANPILRFMQNGNERFAKWVKHPGTKARPFMAEAKQHAEPLFERLCKQAADNMFQ